MYTHSYKPHYNTLKGRTAKRWKEDVKGMKEGKGGGREREREREELYL